MKVKSTDSVFLSDDLNRFVRIEPMRRPKNSHQLVAQNAQETDSGNTSKVTVYNITHDFRECMAFGFEVKEKKVFPVVTHDQQVCFKVLDVKDIIFDETFLFQWGEPPNAGQWRTLKSVAEPKKCLHVEKSGKVSITEQGYSFFGFQDSKQENANAANQYKYKKVSWKRRSLKRRPSCCEASVASHKPLRCDDRKAKRMKMSVKS